MMGIRTYYSQILRGGRRSVPTYSEARRDHAEAARSQIRGLTGS